MPRRAQSVGPSKVVTRCYKGIRQQLPRRAAAADTEIPASDASNASDAFALHRAAAEISQKALQEHGFGSARLSIEDKTEQNGRNTAVQDSDPCLGCIECFGRARLWKRSPLRMHGMLRKCKTMEDRTKRRRTKHISRNHRDPCLRCIECFGRARLYGRQNIECFGNASGGQDYGRQNVECFGSARQWNTGQDKTDETHLDHTWRCFVEMSGPTVRACAVEMHLDIAHAAHYPRIYS